MAYVLGLIITDGCVTDLGTVSLSMNDREVLEKVKIAMKSDHPITPSKQQFGLYHFRFAREGLVKDLAKFGIGPRKSLAVKFPPLPEAYTADFVRGVFDGDGSVFFVNNASKYPIKTKFCSGSKDFIIGLEISLQKLGMPKRTIYRQTTKNGYSYKLRFSHKDSLRLFHIMYKEYPNIPFMERKYNKFVDGFKRSVKHAQRA